MVVKLSGQMYDTEISIPGNQMFVIFQTNDEIVYKGFHALIIESKFYFIKIHQNLEIKYILSYCINFNFKDDHCQYWLNKADGILTSPNFGTNHGFHYSYDLNLNCTWILDTDSEYYITLEIEFFMVNDKDTNRSYFHNFSNKFYHSSLVWAMISQSMMDQIYNHHKYQN